MRKGRRTSEYNPVPHPYHAVEYRDALCDAGRCAACPHARRVRVRGRLIGLGLFIALVLLAVVLA